MGPSPSKRDDWLDEPICDSHAVQQLFSTSIAEVRRLPGWTWGVQVTGIGDAPPPVWPPELWLFVETAAMRHGLVVFNTAGAPRGLAAAPRGEPVDALRAHLLHVVLREQRAAARTGWSWDNHDLRATGGPFEAVFASVYDAYSREEFAQCCAVLEAVAGALQRTLCDRPHADAAAALARVVAAIVETRAHRLQFGNTRYCIAKHFGYVLPTRALVRWLCDQFAGCERVVSVGAGSCFLEAAMQLEMRARGRATVLVCVENDEEMIGARRRDAGGAGFCVAPMVAEPTLEPFAPRDGLFICWGREDERGEGNIWTQAASMAVHSPDVDVAVIIGGADEQWYRCDRFAGHTLGPDSETQQRSGEAGWAGQDSASEDARVENYYGIEDRAVVWRRRPA